MSLSIINPLLDNPDPRNLRFILKSLHLSPLNQNDKLDLVKFHSNLNNLLTSNNQFNKWAGTHIVQTIGSNPIVLTSNGSKIITNLLKIINDSNSNDLLLKNASLALTTIIQNIRGKPVLTREILTPNLSLIIPSLITVLTKDIQTILPILNDLILKNTTTFKPFINKFEVEIVTILTNNYENLNSSLKFEISKSYAYLNLIKPNNSNNNNSAKSYQTLPDDQWRLKIFQIIDELRSAVQVYENLIDLSNDKDSTELLNSLPKLDQPNHIFPVLSIDLSSPISIFQLNKRIQVLIHLLLAFITTATPFALRIPIGLIIQVSNLIMGLSMNYIPLKRELKHDQTVHEHVRLDLLQTQTHGVYLLNKIIKVHKSIIIPHHLNLLDSLQVVIPLNSTKNKIDEALILKHEDESLLLIQTTTRLIKRLHGLNQTELIHKLIDVSLLLLKKKTPYENVLDKQQVPVKNGNGGRSKGKKNSKDAIPMADLLSHSELFEINPSNKSLNVVSKYFEIILQNQVELSSSYKLKIIKFVISTSVKQLNIFGKINEKLVKVLEVLTLNPQGEIYSILPIVKNLLPNNEVLSLLTNPRFPILEVKHVRKISDEDEEDDEEEQEDDEENGGEDATLPQVLESTHIVNEIIKEVDNAESVEIFKSNEEIKKLVFPKNTDGDVKIDDTQGKGITDSSNSSSQDKRSIDDDDTPSKRIKIDQVSQPQQPEQTEESDDDDFVIPEIEIDSDEE